MGPGDKQSDSRSGENTDLFRTDDAVDLYADRVRDPKPFPQEEKVFDRFFTKSNGSVLDVGCGAGRVSILLHERGLDVVGIDVSEPLVESARSRFPELDFRVEDIRTTEFPDERFDYVVFSYFGLDYILPERERKAALREIYRLLKPGGLVVISSHNSWHNLVSVRDFVDLYLRWGNWERLFSRYKLESVPLGLVRIYLSNPLHQLSELRKCGFTTLDVVGKRDGVGRFFESAPHYVAKK